jgi:hypothetical protein
MRRWIRVFKAVRGLVRAVGASTEDNTISRAEMSEIMKAMWAVIRAYKGIPEKQYER